MKKYILALAAVVAAVSCQKSSYHDPDTVGGRLPENESYGKTYMMGIADNLVTDALDELEWALEINASDRNVSSHFAISGNLETPGTTWTVSDPSSVLTGMKLKAVELAAWDLEFDGQYTVRGSTYYPTRFTLHAIRGEATSIEHHFNWTVTLEGSRTERGGYSCVVNTPKALMYNQADLSQSIGGWNKLYGTLRMIVYKNKELVDISELRFNGSVLQAKYERGL